MNNLLSIVTGTHNRADEIIALYEDLKKQTFQDFNLVVMDDVSDKSEVKKLEKLQSDQFYLFSIPPPHKFAGDKNFNILLKQALAKNPKYIYIMHDDMKINSPDLLEKMVAHMEANDACGAVAPTIYNGKGIMSWGPGIIKVRMGKEYIMNESYLVRAECFPAMGFINEKLMYYGSEYYLFNWLRDNNYSTKILGDVSITHYGGGTSTAYQDQKDYYRPRTTILIMKLFCKNDSMYTKMKYFYHEMSETRDKMVGYLKKLQLLKLLRTMSIATAGTFAGLFIRIR